MTVASNPPSYQQLFGPSDFQRGDAARTVYSPAAYLADLLQLIDDSFEDADLDERRSDLYGVPLDGDHTFTVVPYLDIVNEILEREAAGDDHDAYDVLREAPFPLGLPFDLDHETLALCLRFLGVSLPDLRRLFALDDDPGRVARDALGLSELAYDVVTRPADVDRDYLRTVLDLDPQGGGRMPDQVPVEQLLAGTGLTVDELRHLLTADLSVSARNASGLPETERAAELFVNHDLNGHARLDKDEENVVWEGERKTIPEEWFDRVNRSVRLSRWSGIALIDLDRILRCCCDNRLDADAVRTIAVIRHVCSTTDLDVATVCALFADIDTLGIGDDDDPGDPFDRVFNVRLADVSRTIIEPEPAGPAGPFVPRAHEGFEALRSTGDVLAIENKDFRRRISRSLQVSEQQLGAIVEGFRAHGTDRTLDADAPIGGRSLSLLYRITVLLDVLDVTADELYHVLDVVEHDPSIRAFSGFDLLIDTHPDECDCHAILAGGDVAASQWLIQTLIAVVPWMQRHDLTGADLARIATGAAASIDEAERETRRSISFLDGLHEQFRAVMLTDAAFRTPNFGDRGARLVHRAVVGGGAALVSPNEPCLVRNGADAADAAGAAAREALGRLDIIHVDDFIGLGIGEKFVDKILGHLVLAGIVDPDGVIVADAVPATADEFRLTTDFDPQRTAVFDVVHALHREAVGDGDDLIDYSLFESDLGDLDLEPQQVRELYDNLVFNRYVDDEGSVIATDFFGDAANRHLIEVNTVLADLSDAVHAVLVDRIGRFAADVLTITGDVFAGVGLRSFEVDDLLENLRFNGHLDEDDAVVDKFAILAIDVGDFDLALTFYPHRYEILRAITEAIDALRSQVAAVTAADFEPVVDAAVSALVHGLITEQFCVDDRLTADGHEFFVDRTNADHLSLVGCLEGPPRDVVFTAIADFVAAADAVRLSARRLDALGLDPASRDDLIDQLTRDGWIDEFAQILPDGVAYFSNVNNVLGFEIDGYGDFSADVFFIANEVARNVAARVADVRAAVSETGVQQDAVLFDALQEHFEIPSAVLRVVCRYVFAGAGEPEAWMLPVLRGLDDDGRITALPSDHRFADSYRRVGQFAALAERLQLDDRDTEVVFRDQSLDQKFPERLVLPDGIDGFDALLELAIRGSLLPGGGDDVDDDAPADVTCVFRGARFWVYSAVDDRLVVDGLPLSALSAELVDLERVDAAFTDESGAAWLISGTTYLRRASYGSGWERQERRLGEVSSSFDDPDHVDAAFTDSEGRCYLFVNDQYVRYSDGLDVVDEGYPRAIAGNWPDELSFTLPPDVAEEIDAAFETAAGVAHVFADGRFVSSDRPTETRDVRERWGKVRNNLADTRRIDAAFVDADRIRICSGDQESSYSDSIEHLGVRADEGSLTSLADLPEPFSDGVDAAFRGFDGVTYWFKGDRFWGGDDGGSEDVDETRDVWGRVRNTIRSDGRVDAAFTGLDGRTYLFRGDQYVRYSGVNYSYVDEGYPRSTRRDWGGLTRVHAAFVLDGKTYLFGEAGPRDGSEGSEPGYVCYSTNDYRVPDAGFPKRPDDNWWNLPADLLSEGFEAPDSVFIGLDGEVYLFSGQRFVRFDARQRWWSEPLSTPEHWDSIPFDRVDAAFTGKDGRTYLFGTTEFIRYSDPGYTRVDDRYPKAIGSSWGRVDNAIERTGRIDAAVAVRSRVPVDDSDEVDETLDTYLFSGDQFVKYSTGVDHDWSAGYPDVVDEGYPRTIETSLRDEPRFTNLAHVSSGIDAVFADRRTVYVVTAGHCVAASDDMARSYDDVGGSVHCAFLDDARLCVADGDGWHRLTGLEATTKRREIRRPRSLREIPDEFAMSPDAVLQGADGAVHVFRDGRCYTSVLDAAYPVHEEWGRVDNRVVLDGRVDAALLGGDGLLHLFRGDQFVSYTPADVDGAGRPVIPAHVDNVPRTTADHWGGLASVAVAYVRDGVTYLLGPTDDDGRFEYVQYSGSDYTSPDPGFPQTADFSWWEIPDVYREEGFDRVDAVLVDGDELYLISGTEFVHFDGAEGLWAYPRPLDRLWRGLPIGDERVGAVSAAFTAPDGTTWFFGDGASVGHADPNSIEIAEISKRWGVVANHIVELDRVDAAFVHADGATYLFSHDQFVRYSGDDYRFVDTGYPKQIVESLRDEPAFVGITDEILDRLAASFAAGGGLDAVVGNGRTVYLFAGGSVHACSRALTATIPLDHIGDLRNNLAETGQVDAALVTPGGATVLFSGDQYVRYTDADADVVDDGYPRSLETNDEGWPEWTRIDAAFRSSDESTFLFSGDVYAEVAGNSSEIRPIAGRWGRVRNLFADAAEGNVAIDAAFVAPDGSFYAFKDDQYIRYTDSGADHVDEGFPRSIRDNWGDLPIDYEAGIDGGFVFDGRTYLVKGDGGDDVGEEPPYYESPYYESSDEDVADGDLGDTRCGYVRYTDPSYSAIDPIFPQPFTHRWGRWNDFLLTDLHAITRYLELCSEHAGEPTTLTDFLADDAGPVTKPYELLAQLFGWDIDEVAWMKRMNAFLQRPNRFEITFDLELVIKMYDVFRVATKMGSAPSELYRTIWQPIFEGGDLSTVTDRLMVLLASINTEADWEILSRQIHDELNTIRRDALLPYVVWLRGSTDPGITSARDLYELLLIDSEMESNGTTSRVKEAITAAQLYLHRYLMNLEDIELRGDVDEVRRRQLGRWWEWMKNYRVWEANRKVFLYPENYIRPELRDSKTPAFRTLEEDLQQGELDDGAVARAYKKYLDHYTEVSRLKIAGGYVYDDTESAYDKRLILFGRTKTDPRQYWFRTAAFTSENTATWEPWTETKIQINAAHVHPVFAFGRVFVFWSTVERRVVEGKPTKMKVQKKDDVQTITNEEPPNEYVVRIWYSFYNLSGEWVPPQALDTQIGVDAEPTAQMREPFVVGNVELFVENSARLGDDAHENIAIHCRYTTHPPIGPASSHNRAFALTPELYSATGKEVVFVSRGMSLFHQLFHSTEVITDSRIVSLNTIENSTDGPWFSFDHKGGSFLVKPAMPGLDERHVNRALPPESGRTDGPPGFPEWDRVDAAVAGPDGTVYYFRNDTQKYVASSSPGTELDIGARWGAKANHVRRDGQVDTVLHDPDRRELHLFRRDQYVTYSTRDIRFATDDSPRLLRGNPHGFPEWGTIDAAFVGPDHRRYFFNSSDKHFVTSDDLTNPAKTDTRWGQVKTSFTDPGKSKVTGAFEVATGVYVVNGTEFVRYSPRLSTFVDPGYPKQGGMKGLLEDLGFDEVRDELADLSVDVAYGALEDHVVVYNLATGRLITADMTDMTLDYRTIMEWGTKAGYVNDDGEIRNSFADYDAALVTNGDFYAFKGDSFVRTTSIPRTFADITWRNQRLIHTRFGRVRTTVAATGRVDAAFTDGDKIYLFCDGEFVRYTATRRGEIGEFVDPGYPTQLKNNRAQLPKWNAIGGAFRDDDGTAWFFEKDGTRYTTSDDLDTLAPIRDRWGIGGTTISRHGVDAAYTDAGQLFLVKDDEYVRYTPDDGEWGDTIDEGYPKPLPGGMTAAFPLDGYTYLFAGGYYTRLDPGKEPQLSGVEPVAGSWGNLPHEFRVGLDAALRTDDALFLFADDQYVRFDMDEESPRPYEIRTAPFDVIRLTTSTGYMLNQRLFAGGIEALLGLESQFTDEVPSFDPQSSSPTMIRYDGNRIVDVPISSHLDFGSANGLYYWEVFFHAPFLIANALNTAQRFDDAKRWYEFIYDPSSRNDFWTFLPFLSVDTDAIVRTARHRLRELAELGVDTDGVGSALEPVLTALEPLAEFFRGERVDAEAKTYLASPDRRQEMTAVRAELATLRPGDAGGPRGDLLIDELSELTHVIATLGSRYELMETTTDQVAVYQDDPFDPHAIAALRRLAYRKTIVMAYVDNLLDWGDLLFRRYTAETISEARMLYVLAYDLLGRSPAQLGRKMLSEARPYGDPDDEGLDKGLDNRSDAYEMLLALEQAESLDPELPFEPTVHDSILSAYFFIPENDVFTEYWDRVEDRLHKIRNGLNILGIEQPLPLFEPPIDPMAIVQAVGAGAPIGSIAGGVAVAVPHYRFTFMVDKAKQLVQKLSQFGGELLQALEKRDAEELSVMQSRQEGVILSMTREVRAAQLAEVEESLASLRESHRNALDRAQHYQRLMNAGMNSQEQTQIGLMIAGATAQYASVVVKALGGLMYVIPQATIGLFSFGATTGGIHAGEALSNAADAVQTTGEALSMTGEVFGVEAAFERMKEEWVLQKLVADSEALQIDAQIRGAEWQRVAAQREIAILEREIEHNEAVTTFMRDKFTNQQLYQWMAGRLSGTYFQTYKLAHDLARYAEQAYRYERGLAERDVRFIQPAYWDSQRKGLTAADGLGLDIDRMEQAFIETNARRLEISRNISLLDLDPLALLQLKSSGECEFRLPESLFDEDFPGQYCRQVKTISLTFDLGDGDEVLATLTQLSNHTVLEPDAKAVKYLLGPSGNPPLSIRSDWRANQQIALSHIDEYEKNNGLFELRFDDDRYLPFEGTGAVSTWRLTLNGKRGSYDVRQLRDVVVNLKFSALQGGDAFGTAVKGLLKPAPTAVLFDLASDFAEEWRAFVSDGESDLALNLTRDMFPGMSSSKILGLFMHLEGPDDGPSSAVLNGDDALTLKNDSFLETSGLSISSRGSVWSLAFRGSRAELDNIHLVMIYKASVN